MIWEKEGFFWRRKSPYPTSGVVDISYNTATKIVYDEDISDWAQVSYTKLGTLLVEGYRWPEEYGEEYGGRKRDDLTRDPFIGFGALYSHLLGHMDLAALNVYFDKITPPPLLLKWWNDLREDDRKQFIRRLSDWKAIATDNVYQKKYADDFYEN